MSEVKLISESRLISRGTQLEVSLPDADHEPNVTPMGIYNPSANVTKLTFNELTETIIRKHNQLVQKSDLKWKPTALPGERKLEISWYGLTL